MQQLFGGIEFGGTKTVCAIGNTAGELLTQTTLPTTTVDETLAAVYQFFAAHPLAALGVGAFGPLNLDTSSSHYGSMLKTPKAGWADVDLRNMLSRHFGVPVAIDLDVNCAALGELYYGVAQDVNSFVYITVGTGIGGSLIIDRRVVHGILNLEMGHMRVPHETFEGSFKGVCPFHGDCLEGIASGYALQQRYSQKGQNLTDPKAWGLEATYLASALHNIMMTVGPEKIVLGGGIIQQESLLGKIREALRGSINNYMPFPDLDTYIIRSSGEINGVLGAIKLAMSS